MHPSQWGAYCCSALCKATFMGVWGWRKICFFWTSYVTLVDIQNVTGPLLRKMAVWTRLGSGTFGVITSNGSIARKTVDDPSAYHTELNAFDVARQWDEKSRYK